MEDLIKVARKVCHQLEKERVVVVDYLQMLVIINHQNIFTLMPILEKDFERGMVLTKKH